MRYTFFQLARDTGAQAILKAAPHFRALFGTSDHYSTDQTPLLCPQSDSTIESVYPPQWDPLNQIEGSDALLRLRKEQGWRWRQEHTEREAYVQEQRRYSTMSIQTSAQQVEQRYSLGQTHRVPSWEQQGGVLQHNVPEQDIQGVVTSAQLPKSPESTLFTNSGTDTHATEESASQPIRIRLGERENDLNGYHELRTESSSSSSLRRHDAVRYRRNPLFYRDMPSSPYLADSIDESHGGGGQPGTSVKITAFAPNTYEGCYANLQTTTGLSLLSGPSVTASDMTHQACLAFCNSQSGAPYKYFGIQGGTTCRCSNTQTLSSSMSEDACSTRAGGNSTQTGGGPDELAVWQNAAYTAQSLFLSPHPQDNIDDTSSQHNYRRRNTTMGSDFTFALASITYDFGTRLQTGADHVPTSLREDNEELDSWPLLKIDDTVRTIPHKKETAVETKISGGCHGGSTSYFARFHEDENKESKKRQ
ncbi:hypothetical protein N0V83_005285 [Neocucurbitaria cava]|uniref:WSC domain-containing protein n=1 Tax=Neocucurbitaria cava TaxID=798079 RepID=A0A9W8YBM7_9PLEO|nr:hypothetical protein N0V83_005285 [Neocucurbitaria cava]